MRSTVRWEQQSNKAASAVEILSLVKVLCMCRLYDSCDILSRSKNNFHAFGYCEASCKDGTPAGGARVLRVRHEQDLTYKLSNLFLLDEKTASRVTFGRIPRFPADQPSRGLSSPQRAGTGLQNPGIRFLATPSPAASPKAARTWVHASRCSNTDQKQTPVGRSLASCSLMDASSFVGSLR